MAEWATVEVPGLVVLIVFVAFMATLVYTGLVGHRRVFHMLLEQSYRESEKREQRIQATLERIDRAAEQREQAFDRKFEKREQVIHPALERSDGAFDGPGD